MNNRDFIRQAPVSFTCDYNEGAHPEILRRLLETNMLQEPGYGSDRFTQSAIAKIRQATCCPNADVVFLDGRAVTRFATSWATPMEHIQQLAELL